LKKYCWEKEVRTLIITDKNIRSMVDLINENLDIQKISIKCSVLYTVNTEELKALPNLKEIHMDVPYGTGTGHVLKAFIQKANNIEVIDIAGQNWLLQYLYINADDVKKLTTLKVLKLKSSYNDHNAVVISGDNPILASIIRGNAATLEILECSDVFSFDSNLDLSYLNLLTNLKVLTASKLPGAILAAIMENNAANLKELNLGDDCSDLHLEINQVNNLKVLTASKLPGITLAAIIKYNAANLEELNLGDCSNLHLDANQIITLPKLKKFSATAISCQTLVEILPSKVSELEELSLGRAFMKNLTGADLRILEELKFPKLTRLNLVPQILYSIPEIDYSHIFGMLLNNATELEEINFDGCQLAHIQIMQSLNLTKLKKLSVCYFIADPAQTFSALLRMFASQLEELDFSSYSYGDLSEVDVETAFRGVRFAKLKELKINYSNMYNRTSHIFAVIINKAPQQLHDNIQLLVDCLSKFIEYHKATGLIMKILQDKVIQGRPIDKDDMEKILASQALSIKKLDLFQEWVKKADPQTVQEILDKPNNHMNLYTNIVINEITNGKHFKASAIEEICASTCLADGKRKIVLLREWFKTAKNETIQEILNANDKSLPEYPQINNIIEKVWSEYHIAERKMNDTLFAKNGGITPALRNTPIKVTSYFITENEQEVNLVERFEKQIDEYHKKPKPRKG
jgi:hypothetical protein